MGNSVCIDVRWWLWQAVLSDHLVPPTSGLSIHIATCPVCRGALCVLAIEALDLAAPLPDITCKQAANLLCSQA